MIDPRSPNFESTPVAPDRAGWPYAPDPTAFRVAPRPVVTVVTPFFNTGPVFEETARCVLGQSLQNFEWLIINDGSKNPESLATLEPYRDLARRDARVRVIDHKVNSGLSAARNTGFREARAPYVFMLDSDDLIEPTTIEKCALFLECNPAFSFVKGYTVGFAGQQYLWTRGYHDGAAILNENIVTATTMVRRDVHARVGGFDETIRGGLEDWEFWLRCADHGLWGATIPEYLDWYRRRAEIGDTWSNLACSNRQRQFRERMRAMYPRLFADPSRFPAPARVWHMPHADVPERIEWRNPLAPGTATGDSDPRRILAIIPWLRLGGADKFNLDSLRQLRQRGWAATVATTLSGHPWLPEFTRITPDVFMLDHLAPMPEYPRLLMHLIESRRPDVVMISNSELGYLLLPWLRQQCHARGLSPVFVDYNHMEEPYWKNGGHPRHGAGHCDQLDLNIVSSQHLKRWMTSGRPGEGRADPERVHVCYTNVDVSHYQPDPAARSDMRARLGLDDQTAALLYPVRLTAQKQPIVFADTMRRLRDRLPHARFVALVAGDGEDRPALERFIAEHHLASHIRLLGPVPVNDMPAMYNAADVLFLPSMQEGIALSIFEAMACGKPVVGAIVGGQAELVVEGTGFLFPLQADKAAEAEQYARTLARLIEDPQQRRRIGHAAREHVAANHDVARMGQRLIDLFDLARHHQRTQPRQVLTPGLAHELAVAGLDWVRVRDLADFLWPYRQQMLDEQARRQRQEEAARRDAARAVGYIENSTSWRLVQVARRLALRGPDHHPHLDPVQRLEQIKSSTSYKVVTVIKQLPPIRLVSRLRHGPDAHRDVPDPLRRD
jgi:glycosyltransferase involved in cell wall biosynthesis